MHRYTTVAQILLILSIFNHILAAPVVRDTHDVQDDVAVPLVVRNVAIISKEWRSSELDGPMPSTSSPPSPSHSPPLLPEGSTHLYAPPPPQDGESSVYEGPAPAGGPASLAVSEAPGGRQRCLLYRRQAVAMAGITTPQDFSQRSGELIDKAIVGGFTLTLAGGLALYYRLHNRRHRAIDPDWYVSDPRRLLPHTPKRPASQTS